MRKRGKWLCSVVLLATLVLSGCGKGTVTQRQSESSDTFVGEWVVDPEYAISKIGSKDTLFVDGRGEKQAMLGTIKGAIATTWNDWCINEGKQGDEKWGCIQEPADLEQTLGNLGITKDKEIIVLGETLDGWGDDARLVWELLAAGYKDVKMVDGGYSAMKAYGAETQFFASKPGAAEVKIDKIDYTHVMTTEELQKNYDEYKIVDVRTDEEYNGAILNNEAKGGHLPGAIHIRYTDLFDEKGYLKTNEELTEMFEEAGLSKSDEIVTYCTGGIRSAYTQLVLEMCGFEKSYNYDQSFWRWAVVGEVE